MEEIKLSQIDDSELTDEQIDNIVYLVVKESLGRWYHWYQDAKRKIFNVRNHILNEYLSKTKG